MPKRINLSLAGDMLEVIRKSLAGIKPGTDDPGEASKLIWALIRSAETALDDVVTSMSPKPEPPPTLSLYEVRITKSATTLIEVPMTTLGAAP